MPASLIVRNTELRIDRDPVTATDQRSLLDDANDVGCCCGGLGQCDSCCEPGNAAGTQDADGLCCLSITTAPLKTRLTHIYAHYHVRDRTNNKQWIYEATATNLPQDIALTTNGNGCGVTLQFDWTHTFIDFDGFREDTSGSATEANYGVGSRLFAPGRFGWFPVKNLSVFLPYKYTGNFRNGPSNASFTSVNRPNDTCNFANASWIHTISAFKEDTITIQALLEENVERCRKATFCNDCP